MNRSSQRLGLVAAGFAFVAAAGYSIVQIAQVLGYLASPLADTLVYGFSLGIAAPYLVATVCLHDLTLREARVWALCAVTFAAIYVTYVTLTYAIELNVALPAAAAGHADAALAMRPQSLMWTLDGLGYIFMGASTGFAAFSLPRDGDERWLRRFLLANAWLTPVIVFIYVYPGFSNAILLLGSPWIVTCPGSLLLLALHFRSRSGEYEY